MNPLVADHLACPRCGPSFSLVLLARQVVDGRVVDGELGCPNCRDRFPVGPDGVDLRPPPRTPWRRTDGFADGADSVGDAGASEPRAGTDGSRAVWFAAALGLGSGGGLVVMPGRLWLEARGVARVAPGVEVLIAGREAMGRTGPSVTAMLAGPALPLQDGVARGVVVRGGDSTSWWSEALRVLAPGGRLVFVEATDAARDWIRRSDVAVALDEAEVVIGTPAPGRTKGRAGARWVGAE